MNITELTDEVPTRNRISDKKRPRLKINAVEKIIWPEYPRHHEPSEGVAKKVKQLSKEHFTQKTCQTLNVVSVESGMGLIIDLFI